MRPRRLTFGRSTSLAPAPRGHPVFPALPAYPPLTPGIPLVYARSGYLASSASNTMLAGFHPPAATPAGMSFFPAGRQELPPAPDHPWLIWQGITSPGLAPGLAPVGAWKSV